MRSCCPDTSRGWSCSEWPVSALRAGRDILVDFGRRAEDKTTSNILILGNSGQGKSYLLKLILTNIRGSGKRIIVLDPESEYSELCEALGGSYIPSIREFTKPLFSIPTHQFLFNAGQINPKEYMDALMVEPSEFELIKYPERGTCLYRCGNERYLLQVIAPDYKAAMFGKAGGR